MMTASTITLMPDDTTLPSTRSARSWSCSRGQRHEDEASQRGQLEFNDGDEKLDGQNEEGQHHQQPTDQQHDNRQEVAEELREPHQVGGLGDQRIGGGKAFPRDRTRM
jgi:hypothetical protein